MSSFRCFVAIFIPFQRQGTEQLLQLKMQKQMCVQWSSDLRPRPPHPLLQSWPEVFFSVAPQIALSLQNKFHSGGGCPLDFRGVALKDVIGNIEEGGEGGPMSVWCDEQKRSVLRFLLATYVPSPVWEHQFSKHVPFILQVFTICIFKVSRFVDDLYSAEVI